MLIQETGVSSVPDHCPQPHSSQHGGAFPREKPVLAFPCFPSSAQKTRKQIWGGHRCADHSALLGSQSPGPASAGCVMRTQLSVISVVQWAENCSSPPASCDTWSLSSLKICPGNKAHSMSRTSQPKGLHSVDAQRRLSTVPKGAGDAVSECLAEKVWVGAPHTATGPSRCQGHRTSTWGWVVPQLSGPQQVAGALEDQHLLRGHRAG